MNAILARNPPMTPTRKTQAPHRHASALVRPLLRIHPANLPLAADLLLDRIRSLHRHYRPEGAYLWIAPTWDAYVLLQSHRANEPWTRERFDWLVGYYAPPTAKRPAYLDATREGLLEDIVEHVTGWPLPCP